MSKQKRRKTENYSEQNVYISVKVYIYQHEANQITVYTACAPEVKAASVPVCLMLVSQA